MRKTKNRILSLVLATTILTTMASNLSLSTSAIGAGGEGARSLSQNGNVFLGGKHGLEFNYQ